MKDIITASKCPLGLADSNIFGHFDRIIKAVILVAVPSVVPEDVPGTAMDVPIPRGDSKQVVTTWKRLVKITGTTASVMDAVPRVTLL